jgi:uncharacterized protein (TIGR00369 family)
MTQTQAETRTRTFEWDDPSQTAKTVGQLTGLEFLQAISRGELPAPPLTHMLGMGSITAEAGRVVAELDPAEFHYNPLGTVHGGVLATLLDTATGCAVHSTLDKGYGYTSIDLSTKFLRPVTVASGRLRCVGTVISKGRRTALAEARLTDASGRLVATAQSSCLIFEVP